MADRIDRLQRRSRPAGYALAVLYKYIDDQGGYLAALITYYAFVSLFPLLLLLTTVVGFVLAGHPGLQQDVINSALSQFPVVGSQLGHPHQLSGGLAAVLIGVLGALYGGLGVGQATQNVMNVAWGVPRNERPDPFKSRLRSLLLLMTVGIAVLVTTAISAIGSSASSYGLPAKVGITLVAVVLNIGVFIMAFRIAAARKLSARQVLPGAVAAAVIWQLLQSFGAVYVGHVVKNASATNGVFAVVLGLLAFLYVATTALVFCVEINVVRVERLYPRALLTPFTDNVDLTAGDRRAYSSQAQAQRGKGFQRIDVSFHRGPHDSHRSDGDTADTDESGQDETTADHPSHDAPSG